MNLQRKILRFHQNYNNKKLQITPSSAIGIQQYHINQFILIAQIAVSWSALLPPSGTMYHVPGTRNMFIDMEKIQLQDPEKIELELPDQKDKGFSISLIYQQEDGDEDEDELLFKGVMSIG